jgi:hypothetical protein
LAIERQRTEDMKADRDRWAAQAAQLSKRRGLFGWLRRRA